MSKLRIYVDESLKKSPVRHSPLTYPHWGNDLRETVSFSGAFKDHPYDGTLYEFVSDPKDCDCHLWPLNFWATKNSGNIKLLESAIDNAKKNGKKVIIDAFGDTMDKISYEDVIVLRFALYKRNLKENDIIVPAYVEDLLEVYKDSQISFREKQDKPLVGFVGWAKLSFFKFFRTYIKETPIFLWSLVKRCDGVFRKGIFLRSKALKALSRSEKVVTNFLIRSSYSGNTRTAEKDPKILREEFVNNILDTDYTLCQKGDGNQSTRFYEVLSLGRVPLVIDTECVFPLEEKINYKDFCVFVDNKEIKKTAEILSEFHKNTPPEKFVEMQKKAREVFERHIRIDAFTPHLIEEIQNRL